MHSVRSQTEPYRCYRHYSRTQSDNYCDRCNTITNEFFWIFRLGSTWPLAMLSLHTRQWDILTWSTVTTSATESRAPEYSRFPSDVAQWMIDAVACQGSLYGVKGEQKVPRACEGLVAHSLQINSLLPRSGHIRLPDTFTRNLSYILTSDNAHAK